MGAGHQPDEGRDSRCFITGRCQAVRLPLEYRFEGSEVYIRREPSTGDAVLSRRPDSWAGLFALDAKTQVRADFMTWTNHRLLGACSHLSQAEFEAARSSFFPSIRATLNHNLTVDWRSSSVTRTLEFQRYPNT